MDQGSGDGARLISTLRRGRLEIEKKRAISGPIGVRAEVLNWGPILGVIGPPWWPQRVLANGPSPVAREKAGGPSSRLKPRSRVKSRTGADRRRTARERRGTPVESPSCSEGAGGGPGARVKVRPVGRQSSATAGHGCGP
ncbi:hypothetical protein NDU88_003645 [Pleurodeles waltl]|uniref:Uncharacterized protein n=1 Tax=Pleurodeles waltl TaxID=8319 RepID=A0AAV7WVW9_PLEWA|nr:hypothetical protein NDU88_003645 [Pleurodeles waltl]